ncbi:response regulator transcription factor [Aliiglaciecola sp. LCG003]|uniref:response regulator n=1 Tax=Aliiglaciecola sp. LCG003 TaxID=3053655 RepID=UPI0025746E8F|nr:response regulator transcription factor [Aliiglaciecola sp. LCG003]WJG08037.1 response regulator transcription factor [Aliiglaciecola sp. LCG003]
MNVKALIADDHPLFRVALKQAVCALLDKNIAEAASLQETLDCLVKDPEIELVFLDLNMPGNDGLFGLSQIRLRHPDVLVVIVSAEEQAQIIQRAINLGASGFVPKSSTLEQIAEAIEQVLDGGQWLPAHLIDEVEQALPDEQSSFARHLEQLTPQQFIVLKMMADGLLNKQIAYELGIKETTIKQHGSAILKKLKLNNRTQAGVLFKQIMQ